MYKKYCIDCEYYEYDPNEVPERRHQCWHNNNLTNIDIVTGKFNFIESPHRLRLYYNENDEGVCGKIARWFKERSCSTYYNRLGQVVEL